MFDAWLSSSRCLGLLLSGGDTGRDTGHGLFIASFFVESAHGFCHFIQLTRRDDSLRADALYRQVFLRLHFQRNSSTTTNLNFITFSPLQDTSLGLLPRLRLLLFQTSLHTIFDQNRRGPQLLRDRVVQPLGDACTDRFFCELLIFLLELAPQFLNKTA